MLLTLLGHCVELDLSAVPADAAAHLETLWAACRADGGDPETTVRVLPSGSQPVGSDDVVVPVGREDVSYAVSQHLTRVAIALSAGELLMFHAAGLVWHRHESVVGIIAPSGTGKTTFCTALGDRFGYITDETFAVDPHTREVVPYPKPLSIVRGKGVKTDEAPAALGIAPVTRRLPLGALVVAERVERGTSLKAISIAEALALAIPQTSSFLALENPLQSLVEALTMAGGPWSLRFSDQDKCADLLAALPSETSEPPEWTHIPGPACSDGQMPETTLSHQNFGPVGEKDRFVRAPWHDAVDSEGTIVALFGRQPVTLGGAGAVIWRACEQPRTIRELVKAVVEELGDHPRARKLVEEAVGVLASQGVLVLA